MNKAESAPEQTEFLQIIKPRTGLFNLDWKELWQYRELLFFLVWRDIKVKYKQTLLGFAWAILVPVINTVIFTIIFGRVGKMPTMGIPGELFYFSGLLLWTYFQTALQFSAPSLVLGANFLRKIYFPRIIIPTSPSIAAFADFLVGSSVLIILLIVNGILPDLAILTAPYFVFMSFITVLGAGYLLSAMNVQYRDVKIVIPFLIQIWMYASVIYPFDKLPEAWGAWRYLWGLNPMAGAIEGFRWSILHTKMVDERMIDGVMQTVQVAPPTILIAVSSVSMLIIFFAGLSYFRKKEEIFADIV